MVVQTVLERHLEVDFARCLKDYESSVWSASLCNVVEEGEEGGIEEERKLRSRYVVATIAASSLYEDAAMPRHVRMRFKR